MAEAVICSLTHHALIYYIANTVNRAFEFGLGTNKITSKMIYATASAYPIEKVATGLRSG
jgi:hypothetical protein